MTGAFRLFESAPRPRIAQRRAAAFVLMLFVAAIVVHAVHHVIDPGCSPVRTHTGPCSTCAAHHGAMEASETVVPAALVRVTCDENLRTEFFFPSPPPPDRCAPRAPPLG